MFLPNIVQETTAKEFNPKTDRNFNIFERRREKFRRLWIEYAKNKKKNMDSFWPFKNGEFGQKNMIFDPFLTPSLELS